MVGRLELQGTNVAMKALRWLLAVVCLMLAATLVVADASAQGAAAPSPQAPEANKGPEASQRLFEAVFNNDMAAVQSAVTAGADINVRNDWGVTATDLAVDRGYFEIAHYLLSVRNFRRQQQTDDRARPARSRTQAAVSPPAAKSVGEALPATPRPGVRAAPLPATPPADVPAPAPWPSDTPNPFDVTTTLPGAPPIIGEVRGGGGSVGKFAVAVEPRVASRPQRVPAPRASALTPKPPTIVSPAAKSAVVKEPAAPPPPRSPRLVQPRTEPAAPPAPRPETAAATPVRPASRFQPAPLPASRSQPTPAPRAVAPTPAPRAVVPKPTPKAAAVPSPAMKPAVREAPAPPSPAKTPRTVAPRTKPKPPSRSAATPPTPSAPPSPPAATQPKAPAAVSGPVASAPAPKVAVPEASQSAEPDVLTGLLGRLTSLFEDDAKPKPAASPPPPTKVATAAPLVPAPSPRQAMAPTGPRKGTISMGLDRRLGHGFADIAENRQHECARRAAGKTLFCLLSVQWPADLAEAFTISNIAYQGQRTVVRYDRNRATSFYVLFHASAGQRVRAWLTERLGSPDEIRVDTIRVPGKSAVQNPVAIWRRAPGDGTTQVLTFQGVDSVRKTFPDTQHGVLLLHEEGSRPIFPQLSTLDLMMMR